MLNHSYAIWLQSILFLLVFFDSHAGISLLGEVNRVSARLITRGDVVLQLRGSVACSFRSRIDLCHDSAQIVVYQYLSEDQDLTPPIRPHAHLRLDRRDPETPVDDKLEDVD